ACARRRKSVAAEVPRSVHGGPHRRVSSPTGCSTLITVAPRSASVMVDRGPARTRLKSATITPSNFHFTIYGAAGQPRMLDIIRMLWQSTDAYRSVYYADSTA